MTRYMTLASQISAARACFGTDGGTITLGYDILALLEEKDLLTVAPGDDLFDHAVSALAGYDRAVVSVDGRPELRAAALQRSGDTDFKPVEWLRYRLDGTVTRRLVADAFAEAGYPIAIDPKTDAQAEAWAAAVGAIDADIKQQREEVASFCRGTLGVEPTDDLVARVVDVLNAKPEEENAETALYDKINELAEANEERSFECADCGGGGFGLPDGGCSAFKPFKRCDKILAAIRAYGDERVRQSWRAQAMRELAQKVSAGQALTPEEDVLRKELDAAGWSADGQHFRLPWKLGHQGVTAYAQIYSEGLGVALTVPIHIAGRGSDAPRHYPISLDGKLGKRLDGVGHIYAINPSLNGEG